MYDKTIIGHNLSAYYPGDISAALKEAHMAMVERLCIGLPLLNALAPVIIVRAQKI
jgi:hypothetical protein